ncbi:helix-turn-helix domain-containing protein [Arthrobacter sp. lap29]|uniref:helix-turn-helix domain-containing protein n=1 Tax=Arthrobacter sp. lap29 TaxID=3056122 RepID=UPI0028F72A9A|nr:helix-turn-helix domain-containing protein [Arthrobacter sp. lap29]
MGRRALWFSDRADIAVGILAGKTDRQIVADLGRDYTIIWRERHWNSTKTRDYRPVCADCAAESLRSRP